MSWESVILFFGHPQKIVGVALEIDFFVWRRWREEESLLVRMIVSPGVGSAGSFARCRSLSRRVGIDTIRRFPRDSVLVDRSIG